MANVTVKLPEDQRERLRALAAARRRTPHYLMREAIAQYLEREEKREAFRREALESWAHYQETGLHLTGEEAIAWLRSWGTEEEAEAPPCHG